MISAFFSGEEIGLPSAPIAVKELRTRARLGVFTFGIMSVHPKPCKTILRTISDEKIC